ncbi:MAG: PD-(D/E)XK nuclease family protein [Bryobacteraceae bacterium]
MVFRCWLPEAILVGRSYVNCGPEPRQEFPIPLFEGLAGSLRPLSKLSSICLSPENPSTVRSTIVTGNARLMRALRREHDAARAEAGERLWDSPDILSYNGWLRRLWEECVYAEASAETPLLLDRAQEQTLWEEAIARSGVSGPLLNIPETARAAAAARDLLVAWRIPGDVSLFQGLEDTEAFWQWLMQVDRRLTENRWITESELPAAISRRPKAAGLRMPVLLAGFDGYSPADAALFDALRKEGGEIREHPRPAIKRSRVSRVECHSSADEFRAAAVWARTKLEKNPDARLGVIVRGLAGVSASVERTFDDVLHGSTSFRAPGRARAFVIATGGRATDAPILSIALALLKLIPGMPLSEASTLLRSPFTGLDAVLSARTSSDLRRFGFETVSLEVDRIARLFPKMAAVAEKLTERKRPSQWSSIFSKLLTAAGWPGARGLSNQEKQALETWDTALSSLAGLDVVLARLTFDQGLTRLRSIVASSRLASENGNPLVEIMDFPEAEGAQFDAVWVAGMHASAWPQPARPNPFLPVAVQRNAEMPHSSVEWELARAKRAMHRLLASSKEVVCSHPRMSGEEPLRASPLIETLPLAPPVPVYSDTALDRAFLATVRIENVPQGRASELPVGSPAPGGTWLIADQSACPFRAFAKYRLQAREVDEAPLGISASEHGNVAHAAMEIFWREMRTQGELLTRSHAQVRDAVQRAIRAALDAKLSRRDRSPAFARFREFEEQRLERLIEEWIGVEKTRRPFEVVQSEAGETVNIGGLQLKVRVDRIDRYDDGTHGILDYKTSAKISKDGWDGARPDAPQLPLYAAKDELREISEIAFAQMAPEKVQLISESGDSLRERIPEWREVVTRLANEFRTGNAEVDPKDLRKSCEWCDLKPLCRVQEKLGAPVDGNGGADA